MKLTKKQLAQIIREEIEDVLAEASPATMAKNRADKYCAKKDKESAKCVKLKKDAARIERIERARKVKK
tara:strand:- start:62 stop:268 length:207 start_codon:yes stop_codon:yes gene_type:complete